MITIPIILNLIGSFIFYNLSEKTKTPDNTCSFKWIRQNKKTSNIVGFLLLCIALCLLISSFGLISGIFFWFFLLSLQLCLIIVSTPLEIINYKRLGAFHILCLIIEIMIK